MFEAYDIDLGIDWGSGTAGIGLRFGSFLDGATIPQYEKDEKGNRLVAEEEMSDWNARLDPCQSSCVDEQCLVCDGVLTFGA